MSDIEQLQLTMKALGPILQPELISQHSATQWSILFDEDTLIELEYDPQLKQLSLCSALGSPAQDRLLSTLQASLVYNFLWKNTGGIVLALNAPDGELMQLYQLALDEYDTQLLCSVIANFAEKAATWRKLLAAGGINLDNAGVVPSDTLPLNPDTAIRV